jgi:glycolate oxidase FAD binding subunit
MEQVLSVFRERIASAQATRSTVRLRGGGTKDWYGESLKGEVLDTRAYKGIVDYEPTELVITARCGTPLKEIETALELKNQRLAFEPPHFGADATLGGVVASGLSGPARANLGAVRDFVLGVVLMDGRGKTLHFGGQVMKNVAGYDVSRLLAGSLGTLGLLLEVSLKVLPKPFAETTLCLAMTQADAILQMNNWGGQPLPISASVWHDDVLTVRLSGAQAAVDSARKKMGGDRIIDATRFWEAVREQTLPFFSFTDKESPGNELTDANSNQPLWRLSVPSTAKPLELNGTTLIEWGGSQRWMRCIAPAAEIREHATQAGGHATLFRGGEKACGVFQPLAAPVALIHRRLKSTFDPEGIFNPGRMYSIL